MGARFPYGVPTGWFLVAYSHELAPGHASALRCFGEDLVLCRTEDGTPHLRDARAVDGDLTLVEQSGMLLAWHDRARRPPMWQVPPVAEHADPAWVPYRTHAWRIRIAAQEMSENQVDPAHFQVVHRSPRPNAVNAERDGHCLRVRSTREVTTAAGVVNVQVRADNYGLGVSYIRFKGMLETLLVGCTTPVDDATTDLRVAFTFPDLGAGLTELLAGALIAEVKAQIAEDTQIWENKVYVHNPPLVDQERSIAVFRAWARQFYPELTGHLAS